MLVLNRQIGETVRIGNDTFITVLGFREFNGRLYVRMGFDAPKSVAIDREELYAKQAASKVISMC